MSRENKEERRSFPQAEFQPGSFSPFPSPPSPVQRAPRRLPRRYPRFPPAPPPPNSPRMKASRGFLGFFFPTSPNTEVLSGRAQGHVPACVESTGGPAPFHPPPVPHRVRAHPCPLQEKGMGGGGVFFAPSPPTIPTPGLAEPQTPLRRVTASSAAGGKLFVINHVLKDDVMGAFALPLLLPRLRSPGRRAGAEPLYYKSRSQKKK